MCFSPVSVSLWKVFLALVKISSALVSFRSLVLSRFRAIQTSRSRTAGHINDGLLIILVARGYQTESTTHRRNGKVSQRSACREVWIIPVGANQHSNDRFPGLAHRCSAQRWFPELTMCLAVVDKTEPSFYGQIVWGRRWRLVISHYFPRSLSNHL